MFRLQELLTQLMTQFMNDNQENLNHGGVKGNHAEEIHRGGMDHVEGRNTHIPT